MLVWATQGVHVVHSPIHGHSYSRRQSVREMATDDETADGRRRWVDAAGLDRATCHAGVFLGVLPVDVLVQA